MSLIRINAYTPYKGNPKSKQLLIELIKALFSSIPGLKGKVLGVDSVWGTMPPIWDDIVVSITEWEDGVARQNGRARPEYRESLERLTRGWIITNQEETVKIFQEGGIVSAKRDHSIPDEEVIIEQVAWGVELLEL